MCVSLSVCVSQDKDIEGEEEEEEDAVTAVSKVNSTASQLSGRNTDAPFALRLICNLHHIVPLTVAL